MEGKSQLFKHFGNIDAVPIVLSTHDPEQIIAAVEAIAPTFAGINLEDIAAPQCFHIEEELKKRLNIPVMHDDQWGTAVVVLAGLINAVKLADKKLSDCRIVLSGAGAAGTAILKLLLDQGATNILMIDRSGIIYRDRPNNTAEKAELAKLTNPENISGTLQDAMTGADIFIGVSAPNLLSAEDVKLMNPKSIIFALSNPIPEIMPDVAKAAGVFIMATGRSDFPNQVNNALAFPGIFRGAIDHRVTQITIEHLVQAATALANLVSNPDPEKIIPSIFDDGVAEAVAKAIN
jgi:malate dehydrogenase (oxaloacetate-decarboxylating)